MDCFAPFFGQVPNFSDHHFVSFLVQLNGRVCSVFVTVKRQTGKIALIRYSVQTPAVSVGRVQSLHVVAASYYCRVILVLTSARLFFSESQSVVLYKILICLPAFSGSVYYPFGMSVACYSSLFAAIGGSERHSHRMLFANYGYPSFGYLWVVLKPGLWTVACFPGHLAVICHSTCGQPCYISCRRCPPAVCCDSPGY